jgi:uncharacterized membrane protein
VRVLVAVVGVGYPFLVYAGLLLFEPRLLVVLGGGLRLARAALSGWARNRAELVRLTVPACLVAAVLLLAAVFNDGRFFLFVPALFNAALLTAFGRTLRRSPSMVETLARLRRRVLPDGAAAYCRAVTWIWCGFFAVNITISVLLALYSTLALWTAYNGMVAYGLVGILLATERVYRYWRFRVDEGTPLDAVFRRLFPPPTAGAPSTRAAVCSFRCDTRPETR